MRILKVIPNSMAQYKALLLVAITLFLPKMASSFPAVYDSLSRVPAADHDRTEPDNVAYYEQAFDEDLLSVLPCEGTSIPQQNYTRIHKTRIEYDTTLHEFVCKAVPIEEKEFANPVDDMQRIQTPNFPKADSYPGDRLLVSNFSCPSKQEPVIDLINVLLQQQMAYGDDHYCVDYVKIDPPINNNQAYFCGNVTLGGPFHFGGAKTVQVTFRTSHRNNAHKGFCIWLHCETSRTAEENTLLQHLQPLSKFAVNHQRLQAENSDSVQFESLAKLVNFASHQCKSAYALQVPPYWDIVELALQYERADDEQVQRIAQDVLRCFSPSQINFARIEMDEKK